MTPEEYVQNLYKTKPIQSNIYFQNLEKYDQKSFMQSQVPLIFLHDRLGQLYSLLLASVNRVENRIYLLHIIEEEFGNKCYEDTKVVRFYNFLTSLGYPEESKFPKPDKFILKIVDKLQTIIHENKQIAVACLIILEVFLIEVNNYLYEFLLNKQWVISWQNFYKHPADNKINHYYLFKIMTPHWSEDINNKNFQNYLDFKNGFEQGLDISHRIFNYLYSIHNPIIKPQVTVIRPMKNFQIQKPGSDLQEKLKGSLKNTKNFINQKMKDFEKYAKDNL